MEINLVKLAVLLPLMVPAMLAAASGQSTYIPYELGGDNYYTMQGGPDISASISGTDEFGRGDTVTVYLDLTNYGRILGFKEDQTPQNPKEYALAASELQKEYSKPTALGITATLSSLSPQIEVKSGDQVVESLKSGDKTKEPLQFSIKIGEHAPAGEYSLQLNLSYDYQDNVRVYAAKLLTEGGVQSLVNYRESYVYQKANQSVPIIITVKKEADFEILNASGTLSAGSKKEEVSATYRNIGEDPIRDAVARLSIFKPFSSAIISDCPVRGWVIWGWRASRRRLRRPSVAGRRPWVWPWGSAGVRWIRICGVDRLRCRAGSASSSKRRAS